MLYSRPATTGYPRLFARTFYCWLAQFSNCLPCRASLLRQTFGRPKFQFRLDSTNSVCEESVTRGSGWPACKMEVLMPGYNTQVVPFHPGHSCCFGIRTWRFQLSGKNIYMCILLCGVTCCFFFFDILSWAEGYDAIIFFHVVSTLCFPRISSMEFPLRRSILQSLCILSKTTGN